MTIRVNLEGLEEVTSRIITGMDPRLQLALARRRTGMVRQATASTDVDEIGVVAKVDDAASWIDRTDIRDGVVIGTNETGEQIVTGRIPIHRIELIRGLPFVKSLKAAVPVRAMLAKTTEETNSLPSQLPAGHHTSGGKGVIVGIVDYGCDFAHQNFRKANGTTRVLDLWDQNGGNTPSSPSPFGYGHEFNSASINLALSQSDPYSSIGYDPANYDDGKGAHGTHVMDIAAGNGRGTGEPGIAPDSDIIFVNITHDKDANGTGIVGASFGDSVALLEAIKYVFDKAGAKPCVINVSLGTNGGPHDGTTLVEQGIDAMLTAAPNRAAVFAASNSFDDGIHAAGTVSLGASVDLAWDVASNLVRDIELEVWFAGADRFKVELLGPNGAVLATAMPGETKQLIFGGSIAALVANRLNDPNNHDNMIGIFLASGMPAGRYIVRLTGVSVTSGAFHAWIERDNLFQSGFPAPNDNSYTIGSVSCGKHLIAVGSYDGHDSKKPLSYFSSAGPTRDGREKPEISAPGHNVWAAKSSTGNGVTRMSGTSMASPAVAGHIALIFEEAQARGLKLSIQQTKDILVKAARRNPPTGTAWHDRYGAGRIDSAEAIRLTMAIPVPPAAGTPAAGTPGAPAALAAKKKGAASKSKPSKSAKTKAAKGKKGKGS